MILCGVVLLLFFGRTLLGWFLGLFLIGCGFGKYVYSK